MNDERKKLLMRIISAFNLVLFAAFIGVISGVITLMRAAIVLFPLVVLVDLYMFWCFHPKETAYFIGSSSISW
jgi:hypothetical protein